MELLNYFFTGLYICSQTYAIQVKTEMLRSNKLDAGIFNFIKDPKSNMNTCALLHECDYNVPSSLVFYIFAHLLKANLSGCQAAE